jgi:hypothetical protein
MASTNLLYAVTPAANYYSGSNPATPDYDGDVLVLDFNDGTDEFAEFLMFLPAHYGGTTGITFGILWSSDTATSGNCIWNIAIQRIEATSVPSGSSFTAVNAVTDACTGDGEAQYASITFTDGADMDSWATGEWAKVRVSRDADNGADTMTGDAQLHSIALTET